MAKVVSVNAGHTLQGQKGAGASYSGLYEGTITRQVASELIKLLKAQGYRVFNSTVDKAASQNDYLKKVCKLANNVDADLFISLHTNASSSHKGQGCEVYTWKGNQHKEAVSICANLEELGLKNRGVKDGSKLYVIKHTNPKALLIELFFIDNAQDREIFQKKGAKQLAKAICEAL